MISVIEAKQIIEENVSAVITARIPLQQAAGKVLAEDVYAVRNIPAFPQSSMDGYAFLFSEWKAQRKLLIEGEIAAGANERNLLGAGKAARIFTGAPVPPGADTVVMQEKIRVDHVPGSARELIIEDELLKQGTNVRPVGSEIKAGELALAKESFLSPAAIGFLAGIGVVDVNVYLDPVISIIVTGKELQPPGTSLQYGQVYESNSFMLKAALEQLNITGVKIIRADDDLEMLKATLADALLQSNMVLLTGGISAGDYDFVLQAATGCGVQKLFHKVKQRPGKPLYFGMTDSQPVFGLPGNPSSVLTCFYEYVIPVLEKISHKERGFKKIKAPLAKTFRKAAGLTHFLKGYYDGSTALQLDAQESYRLSSFAKANCLIQIDEGVTVCEEGEIVEIHLLPV